MKKVERQQPGLRELAMKVMLWITFAKRPLTTLDLQHALATKVRKSSLDKADQLLIPDVLSACSGLVTIDEKSHIIRLVHYTTQEYLVRTQRHQFLDAHTHITIICIALSVDAFHTGRCITDDEFAKRLQSYPLFDYAARYWSPHALQTSNLP